MDGNPIGRRAMKWTLRTLRTVFWGSLRTKSPIGKASRIGVQSVLRVHAASFANPSPRQIRPGPIRSPETGGDTPSTSKEAR